MSEFEALLTSRTRIVAAPIRRTPWYDQPVAEIVRRRTTPRPR
jgi:hypothetical protein